MAANGLLNRTEVNADSIAYLRQLGIGTAGNAFLSQCSMRGASPANSAPQVGAYNE
jgi:hypothetical protein